MAFERGTFTGNPNGCLVIIILLSLALMGGVACVAVQPFEPQEKPGNAATAEDYSTMHDYLYPGGVRPKPSPGPSVLEYTPNFGLDPVGQAILRANESNMSQEGRIRLLENQVAQLQRIVFSDPTIRAPRYRDEIQTPFPDPNPNRFPFGESQPPKR